MEITTTQQPITQNNFRYFKDKKPIYKPIEDGFITTSGNPSLGMKYGNIYPNVKPVENTSNIKFNNGLGIEWQS